MNHVEFTFRPARGAADAEALLAVRQGCAAHDGHDPLSSVESPTTQEGLSHALLDLEAHGALDRLCVVEAGGEVIGYGGFYNWVEADGMDVWLHLGWVLPAWRGRGVGTELIRRLEGRIRELADGAGPGRWEFAANASSAEPEANQLLLDNGYRPAYTVLEMALDWADLPRSAVALPEGLTTRPFDPDDVPAITLSVSDSYLQEYPDNRYQMAMDVAAEALDLLEPPHDPTLWQVAWDGDAPAGQVLPVIERGRAEIYEVSVRPAYRRRGLARALLTRALLDLERRGVAAVRLHTVAEFPTQAQKLYESVGFRTVRRFPRYRKTP